MGELSNASGAKILLKARQPTQNGVVYAKPHVAKPRLRVLALPEPASPRNRLISAWGAACLVDPSGENGPASTGDRWCVCQRISKVRSPHVCWVHSSLSPVPSSTRTQPGGSQRCRDPPPRAAWAGAGNDAPERSCQPGAQPLPRAQPSQRSRPTARLAPALSETEVDELWPRAQELLQANTAASPGGERLPAPPGAPSTQGPLCSVGALAASADSAGR